MNIFDVIKTLLILLAGINMLDYNQLELEIDKVEKKLKSLRKRAIKDGQSLLLEEKVGEIFVGDAIRRHPIDNAMILHLMQDLKILQKCKSKPPKYLLDVVAIVGGFKELLLEIHRITIYRQTLNNEEYKNYLMHLSEVLQLCKTYAFKRTAKIIHSTLECCLCWRAVKPGSTQYCVAHQEDKMLRQRDQRRLYAAIMSRNEEHSAELKRRLASKSGRKRLHFRKHYWSSFFAEDLTPFQLRKNTKISIPSGKEWREDAQLFLDYLKDRYIYWNEYIRRVSPRDSKDWVSWLGKIRKRLDPKCPPVFTAKDIESTEEYPVNIWLCPRGDIEDWALLLRIVQRFESYHALHSAPKKRGPQIGTVPKNYLLREKIKKIANRQMKQIGKIKAVAIADELSISPQRISILLKELGLR